MILLQRLRKVTMDRSIRKGSVGSGVSLIRLDPHLMRYIEAGRCIDLYVERSGNELLFDRESVRQWHSQIYSKGSELGGGGGDPLSAPERERVCAIVEDLLRIREPTRTLVIAGSIIREGEG